MDPNSVIKNYQHGRLLSSIREALEKMNVPIEKVTTEILSPVDEFHVGGRIATSHLLERMNIPHSGTVLDVGCGLGGAARFVAQTYSCQVEGLDLCEEYIETGRALNEWVKLGEKINLKQGSALDLPYPDTFFDGAYQLHVGMNIENKLELFQEVYRVLKPGATYGVYDIMATSQAEIQYPVPWAADSTISRLASPQEYRSLLEKAGFAISIVENRKDFALEFFQKMKAKAAETGQAPLLGLHTLMQASTPTKLKNMLTAVAESKIAPVEIVGIKR